jgi:hypothetical protein
MTSVSVFIPSYNQQDFLVEAIDSAKAQRDVAEILVSDDKSTDDSLSVIQREQLSDKRIRAIVQPVNLGIPGNIDSGMRSSIGEYVFRLDADDRMLPGACGLLAEALDKYPQAGCAHGQIWEIDVSGSRVKHRRLARSPGYQDSRSALLDAARGYRVAANLVMFRREALTAVDYLAGRPSFAEDYHLYAALAAAGWGNVYVGADIGEYRSYTTLARSARKASELQGLRAVFDQVLAPAYRKAGLPASTLLAGRRNISASQARYLLETPRISPAQAEELQGLLHGLYPTPWPKIYLAARALRMAPAFLAYGAARQAARQTAKTVLLRARSWLGPGS